MIRSRSAPVPTYDYHCLACEHAFALEHSMKDAPRRKCPKCGKNRLERRIGPGAGIVFKGSGFYVTDYRSKAYQEAAKSESKEPAKAPGDAKPGEPSPKAADAPSAPSAPSDASAKPAKPGAAKPKRAKD